MPKPPITAGTLNASQQTWGSRPCDGPYIVNIKNKRREEDGAFVARPQIVVTYYGAVHNGE